MLDHKIGLVGPTPLIFSMTLRETLCMAIKILKPMNKLEMIQKFYLFDMSKLILT